MNWHDLAAIVVAVLALLGVLTAPELGRRAGKKSVEAMLAQAQAAQKHAEAAKDEAAAEMRKAVAAEREQASADWSRYVSAKDREIARLDEQGKDNAARISAAEIRAESDRIARVTAESNFRKAVIWIRQAIAWINEQLPGANYPPLPPELDIDL